MTKADAFAPAKINLTLHVTGRRADGYHLLDSLVAFAGVGDHVSVAPSDSLSLEIDGPEAAGLEVEDDNLVLRAARFLAPGRGAAIHLTKRLPVSSGIGGGSADAAATLRALSALWDVPLPAPADTAALGADVPVCLAGQCCRMSGIGEQLSAPVPLPPLDILLVNPRVAVSTPAIFKTLKTRDNPPMPSLPPADLHGFSDWLSAQRNDLAPPAKALAPDIAAVLDDLRALGPLHAVMSGSGATCFALYPQGDPGLLQAESHIRRTHPNWWCASAPVL